MKHLIVIILLFSTLFFSTTLKSQNLISDIKLGIDSTISGAPEELIVFDNKLYFIASDESNGKEIWVSDGTPTGTHILKDINIGERSSDPKELTIMKNHIYFIANDGIHGNELWRTDGTAQGTQMVIDRDRWSIIFIGDLTFDGVNSLYYIDANRMLYKTDGTAEGTIPLLTTYQGYEVEASRLFLVGKDIFFIGNTSQTGQEIWKTDGKNVSSMERLTFLTINAAFSPVSHDYHWGTTDSLLFIVVWYDGTTKRLLRVGGQPGSYSAVNLFDGIDTDRLIVHKDNVYYNGLSNTGREPYVYNIPQDSFFLLKDISPGGSSSIPRNFFIWNDTVHFTINNSTTAYLWKTDGTTAGTVKAIDSIPIAANFNSLHPTIDSNNILYFRNEITNNDGELWRSDGTNTGTYQVKDINLTAVNPPLSGSSPKFMTIMNNEVYFQADDGITGAELWKSDGTAPGTELLMNIGISDNGSNPIDFTALQDLVVFSAEHDSLGRELYVYNSINGTSTLLKDIYAGATSSNPTNLIKQGNYILFSAENGTDGNELWRTDGTAQGTILLKDITAGASSSSPRLLTTYNGKTYFAADGNYLWETDGTNVGTVLVKNISYGIFEIKVFGNKMYLNGTRLWESMGTNASTQQIGYINGLNKYLDIVVKQNTVYFKSEFGAGFELYKTQGNSSQLLANINSTISANGLDEYGDMKMTVFQDTSILFIANDGVDGRELWRLDSYDDTPYLFKSFYAGSNGGWVKEQLEENSEDNFLVMNDEMYFFANDGLHGVELWKTNGTDRGTVLIKDINEGISSSRISYMTRIKDVIYFSAFSDEYGAELWRTDGTSYGTFMINDMNSGLESSAPKHLTNINDTLYFSANNGLTGHEPYFYVPNCNTYQEYKLMTCIGDTSIINNQIYTQAGEYLDTLVNATGCDSLIKIKIDEIQPNSTIQVDMCEGDFYEWNGKTYTTPGNYVDTVWSCYQPIYININTIRDTTSITRWRCANDTSAIEYGDYSLKFDGCYSLNFKNQNGCDSIVIIDLKTAESTFDLNETICQGDTLFYNNQTFTQSGNYNVILQNFLGCDSLVNLSLNTLATSQVAISDTICFDGSTTYNGQVIDVPGSYNFTFQNNDNCDSMVVLEVVKMALLSISDSSITFNNGSSSGIIDITVTGGLEPYQFLWNNGEITEDIQNLNDGQYIIQVTDALNCMTIDTFNVFTVNVSSIMKDDFKVKTFPNPSQRGERLTILFGQNSANVITLKLSNTLGQELIKSEPIFARKNATHQLLLPKEAGIYILQFFENEVLKETVKIIVN